MNIIKVKNYRELSYLGAKKIADQVAENPYSVLGLATGATPEGIYQHLASEYQKGTLDFSQCSSVNLDEYKGLSREDEQSYYHYMKQHLFSKINLPEERIYFPDALAKDAQEECRRYDEDIEKLGGVDLQLLGIGRNGHIGFNEPGDFFPAATHCVSLSQSTLDANAKYFPSKEEMPKEAYTVGIGVIMKAKKILLVANGESKREALRRTIFGKVTPQTPASILQFHPNVTIIGDEEALSFWND